MKRFNRLMLLLLLGSLLPLTAAQAQPPVRGTAPLGTTTVINIELTQAGATEAQIYEAWPAVAAKPLPAAPVRVPLPNVAGSLDPQLLKELAVNEQTDFVVFLQDQADLSGAYAIADWNERGNFVVDTLKRHAHTTQADVRRLLEDQKITYESFWIVNALEVHGDRALAEQLAQHPDVGVITANPQASLDLPAYEPLPPAQAQLVSTAATTVPWGLEHIHAPRVWDELGVRGQGIVVANLDTGVQLNHEALQATCRGWSSHGVSHDYNWFDPTEYPMQTPGDQYGHGTHTMGTMVGGAIAEFRALGVAPDARWIAARGCNLSGCVFSEMIAVAEWMLAPTRINGTEPRPDLRPHVINNSWSSTLTDPWYYGYVEAWNAAGIITFFANGNNGEAGCVVPGSPAGYDNVISIGATDSNDAIAPFSSRGRTADGRIKPDMSAPGVDIISSISSDYTNVGLRMTSGTSMAAPHVTGVAALLLSANPELIGDVAAVNTLLNGTSVPLYSTECGDPPNTVPNAVFGSGRLDAYAAVEAARVDVPWMVAPETVSLTQPTTTISVTLDARAVQAPGLYHARIVVRYDTGVTESIPVEFDVLANAEAVVLQGRLLDEVTSTGIKGQLQLDNGPTISSAADGTYHAVVLPGTYAVEATSFGYLPLQTTLIMSGPRNYDVSLSRDAPEMLIDSQPISVDLAYGEHISSTVTITNTGSQPLRIAAQIPPDEWSLDKAPLTTPLYDLSAVPPLDLLNDEVHAQGFELGFHVPIFGASIDTIYVSANGWITGQYKQFATSSAYCFPETEEIYFDLPPFTLAPFFTNLNPQAGGAVRAGHIDPDTFVVSYEAVPHKFLNDNDPTPPTYTFQVALHADGTIDYLYGEMGELPDAWSIGTSMGKFLRGQTFACHRNVPTIKNDDLSNQRWTIMNQPAADVWAQVAPAEVIVAPGESTNLTVDVTGIGYRSWRSTPLHATVQVHANDPFKRSTEIPISMQVGAPPVTFWLPTVHR